MDHFQSLYLICYNNISVLCFVFLPQTCGILAPQSEIEPAPPTLIGRQSLKLASQGHPFISFFNL